MSRRFVSASAQYFSAIVTPPDVPLTMACWFRTASTAQQVLMSFSVATTGNGYHLLQLAPAGGVRAQTFNGAATFDWSETSVVALNKWEHAVGVWTSPASRTAYRNGIAAATNVTNISPLAFDRVLIGQLVGQTTIYMNGLIASRRDRAPAIWNCALTPSEIKELASGAHPETIRPQNLWMYGSLDEQGFGGPIVRSTKRAWWGFTDNGGVGLSPLEPPLRLEVPRRFCIGSIGITFDAASNSGYQTAQSTYSWSHTCTGTDRLLRVGISMLSVGGSSVSSITYNGVALSLVRARASAADAVRAELWELVAPATGANNIVVTLSAALDSIGSAVSRTGVHQTLPSEGAADASDTNVGAADATVNVATVADNDIVDIVVASSDTAITVGAGQTARTNVTGALGSGAMSDEGPKTPAGTVTMSYTDVAALATWTVVAAAVRPVAAAGAGGFFARHWYDRRAA